MRGPKDWSVLFGHESRFGGCFGLEESSGELMYSVNGHDVWVKDCTEERLLDLIEKSCKENKDLVFEAFKDCKIEYKPGCLY